MITTVAVVGLTALALHLYRQYWFNRDLPQMHAMKFDGELYRVGETSIAIHRPAEGASRTLICFPGFLEDVRYFLSLYEGRGYELILINNANYHSPFDQVDVELLAWATNPHRPGSIAYDGFVVAQAVQHLATTGDIVIHGHSRGGAVVLDAGRQFPDVMKDESKQILALLEAAVLPQGTQARGTAGPVVAAITLYLMPIVLGLMRNISRSRLAKLPMMNPNSELKMDLLVTLFCNAKNYSTCVVNARDIAEWQSLQRYGLYSGYRDISVLVGERDDVLSTETMTASAQEGCKVNSGVKVVQTRNTNHFISLETPEAIYLALGDATAP